jgi:hypothetical protein
MEVYNPDSTWAPVSSEPAPALSTR